MDILLVRKSGPVSSMKFRTWWIYFLFLVMLVMLAGLGAGSYLLYRQQQAIMEFTEELNLLTLRVERLESLAQDQENRALLAQQEIERKAEMLAQAKLKAAQAKPGAANKAKAAKTRPEKAAAGVGAPPPVPPQPPAQLLPPEPHSSDMVGVRNIRIQKKGGNLVVRFQVSKKAEGAEPLAGYLTLVVRGQRAGKPWVEAWPPMRLTPLGRPLNFRRGTPFSVQRFREIKAKFVLGDKKFSRLEFLVFSKDGELMLVVNKDLEKARDGSSPTRSGRDGR